jgi:NAD(P)-dependent dehydrogenase (short-subunit alcohol dehydrogenase family)
MDLGLKGRTAIVTGGSKGIGRAAALTLAQEGVQVVVTARGAAAIDETVEEIRRAGGEALGVPADASKAEAAPAIVQAAIAQFGKVDILVNNAGGQRVRAGFDELTDQDFLDAFEDNVLSVVRMVRAVLPSMRERRWGRIINIVSETATQPLRTFHQYNAAKAAELNLTKSLSMSLAKDGILVNAVAPGLISTVAVEESFARGAQDQQRPIEDVKADFFRKFKPGLVLSRAGESEEVASVIAFLASDRASYITGSNYRVDGGAVVGMA